MRNFQSAVAGETRVAVHQLTLGSTNQQTVLYLDLPGSGLASLTRRRRDHFGVQFSIEESMRMCTFETWCSSAGSDQFEVLKLNVEGHEVDVLNSAGAFLTAFVSFSSNSEAATSILGPVFQISGTC